MTGPAAKLLLWHSNARQQLSDLEEAWLVRAPYREDKLNQPQIAQLVGRDKSYAPGVARLEMHGRIGVAK